jgi:hypothetical protein
MRTMEQQNNGLTLEKVVAITFLRSTKLEATVR